jgi:dihydroorotase
MTTQLVRVPAFVDLHVHFREPGFTEKEDIESGVRAAAAGGYRAVCLMPNTLPALDNPETLLEAERRGRECGQMEPRGFDLGEQDNVLLRSISTDGNDLRNDIRYGTHTSIRGLDVTIRLRLSNVCVFAASAMTIGQAGKELVDFDAMDNAKTLCRQMTGHGVCGITEDGKTLYDYGMMEKVCEAAVRLGLPVMEHAEPEADIIRRDLELARRTGARFHFQHISLEESVRLIRAAKIEGLPVTCEAAPHHFALSAAGGIGAVESSFYVSPLDTNAKMNPPLRTEKDRLAIIEGLVDGTIDCIATDHAPHEAAVKNLPYNEAANGVIGLETAFPVSYTILVKGGFITLEKLIELMSTKPAEIIGLPPDDTYVALDLETPWTIDASAFCSRGRNTPFDGMRVYGRIVQRVKEKS